MWEQEGEVGDGVCGDGGEGGEGTHFALARFFGGESPALRGRWHLGRQAHPGSTRIPHNNTQGWEAVQVVQKGMCIRMKRRNTKNVIEIEDEKENEEEEKVECEMREKKMKREEN